MDAPKSRGRVADGRPDIRTPVTLLTGFLGSGKTTLLNRALRDASLARSVVIINEFGEIGLDHALVTNSSDTITLLQNGCLCCTVFGDLIGTLNQLYYQRQAGELPPFDRVLIETSGLADPRPVLQAFLSDPTLEGLYRVAGVITVVDAVNAATTLEAHPEFQRQVALADHVLITKRDLLAPDRIAETSARLCETLRSLNPAAELLFADQTTDAAAILRAEQALPSQDAAQTGAWLNVTAYAAAEAEHPHRHRETIHSFCFVREQPIPREALQLLLGALEQNLGPALLRVKGLVNVLEQPAGPAVIQGAQHLLHNLSWLPAWPDADRRTRIVFIADGVERGELEQMISLLDRVAMRTAAARRSAAARLAG